jgi:hypothetical protein
MRNKILDIKNFIGYAMACWFDQRNGRDCGQGIPETPNLLGDSNMPRPKDDFAESLDVAVERLEKSLIESGVWLGSHPNRHREPRPVNFQKISELLGLVIGLDQPAEWIATEHDSEPWTTLAAWVEDNDKLHEGDAEVFIVNLTACDLTEESGPCGGGHIIINDTQMLVHLVMYAAPHCTGGRALAIYQVEVLSA